jgi:hypothetical protein
MNAHRSGEQGNIPTRNDRYFQQQSYWYYTTREGVNIGPFDSKSDAEVGATDFIDYVHNAGHSTLKVLEQYRKAVA